MRAEFTYIETDDDTSSFAGLTYQCVTELIKEHNEYFETDYQSISEFNESEPHREILVNIKQ